MARLQQVYVFDWFGKYVAFYGKEAADAFVRSLDRDESSMHAVPVLDSVPLDSGETLYDFRGEEVKVSDE